MAVRGKPKREQTDVGESGDGCTTLFGWKHYALFPILGVMYATRQLHCGVNENQDVHTTAGIECRGLDKMCDSCMWHCLARRECVLYVDSMSLHLYLFVVNS